MPYGSKRKSTRANVDPLRAMDDLSPRPWQPSPTHQAQEITLEHRVATGVDEQIIEEPTSPTTGATQEPELGVEHEW